MPLRGSNPAGRFLLKGVQDVQDALKANGIDGPVCIAVEVVADLKNPAKTLEGFRVLWMIAELRFKKGLPDFAANGRRKTLQVFPARAHKDRGLERAQQIFHYIIVIYLWT